MKLPFMKWYPNDWLRDTRGLSLQSKGAWTDILNIAWNEPQRGIYKRWPDNMIRELGIPDYETLTEILVELQDTATILQVCECDEPNGASHECLGEITITSRRMVKEERYHKMNAERQRRHYYKRNPNAKPNENLTDKMLDVRRYKRLTSSKNAMPFSTPAKGVEGNAGMWIEKALDSKLPELPESERMSPEEMKAIRLKNLGELK